MDALETRLQATIISFHSLVRLVKCLVVWIQIAYMDVQTLAALVFSGTDTSSVLSTAHTPRVTYHSIAVTCH